MTNIVLYWLLFAVPVLCLLGVGLLFGAALLGAWLYHAGSSGRSPALSLPKFSISRAQRNGGPSRSESDRLPAV